MKQVILRLYFIIFLVVLVFLSSSFLLAGDTVLALSSNYSKISGASLSVSEWNNLKNDFLAKSGGTDGIMSGNLDASFQSVTGVGSAIDANDVVNKGDVDARMVSSAGGAVFTNWGRNDCPSGTQELYEGFGFGNSRRDGSGSSDIVCLAKATSSPVSFSGGAGQMYPLTSLYDGLREYLPAEITIGRFIRCSVCYNPGSTCYVKYGDENCEIADFNSVYQGYVVGALRTFSSHVSSRKRICLNKLFDATEIPASTPDSSEARLYGSRIDISNGLTGFTEHRFMRCTVCCN